MVFHSLLGILPLQTHGVIRDKSKNAAFQNTILLYTLLLNWRNIAAPKTFFRIRWQKWFSHWPACFHLGYVVLGALPVFPALATKDPLRTNMLLNEMIRSSFFCELHQSDILCVCYTYVPLVSNTERRRKDILYIGTLEMLPSLFCSTGLSI